MPSRRCKPDQLVITIVIAVRSDRDVGGRQHVGNRLRAGAFAGGVDLGAELLDQGLAMGVELLLSQDAPGDLPLFDIVASLQGRFGVPALGTRLGAVDELLGALRDNNDVAKYGVELFGQLNHGSKSFSSDSWNAFRMASNRAFMRFGF